MPHDQTIHFSDPLCGYAATRPGHVCKDSHQRTLGKPGMDGACDIWARHEAYLGRELIERLDADTDLVFARLADVLATDLLSARHHADTAHAQLRELLERVLPHIGHFDPEATHALRERLNVADHWAAIVDDFAQLGAA